MRFDSNTVAPLSAAIDSASLGSHLTPESNALISVSPSLASSSLGITVPPAASIAPPGLRDPELNSLSQTLGADGTFNRTDLIQLLRNAGDNGSVDANEFADLKTIISPSSPVAVPEYVRVLANKVVNGDRANQWFQGGTLGNLAPGSTSEHLEKLVQKWFYGSDRPTTSYSYQAAEGVLFKDGASKEDVRQGIAVNCYLTAAAAGIAYRNSKAIEEMFIDNGDNTYTVRFFKNGVADYVTVDRYLPATRWGTFVYTNMNSKLSDPSNELWAALLEKAYAQLNESGWIGQDGTNSYSGLGAGFVKDAMMHLTNQASIVQDLNQSAIAAAVQSGSIVTINTLSTVQAVEMVPDHAYLVTSYNADTQKFSLYNPWGVAGNKDGHGVFKPGVLELGWGEIASNFTYETRAAA